jgi:hypothetical protein
VRLSFRLISVRAWNGPLQGARSMLFLSVLTPAKRLEVSKDSGMNTVLLKFAHSLFLPR